MPVDAPQKLWGAVAQQCLSLIQQEEGAFALKWLSWLNHCVTAL